MSWLFHYFSNPSDGSPYEKRVDKKGNILSDECIADEVPFEIPESWEWVRLGEVADYRKGPFGSSLTKAMFIEDSPAAIKVYEQKNAINKSVLIGNYFISPEKYETMRNFEVFPGDIIVSCAGTIGESYVLPENARKGIINQALMRIKLYNRSVEPYYLAYFDFILKKTMYRSSKGSAIKNIPPFNILKNLLIPLPPLAEQHRIVEHINELMPLVDEYGELEDAREKLDIELPDRLRKSVLQTAVQGKLVPQDPSDEPASILLEHIRGQRAELIQQKKMKAPKGGESIIFADSDGRRYEKRVDAKGRESEPVCIEDEIPFEIPESWEWARLESVTTYIQRGKSPKYSIIEKYPVVAQKCNQWSGFSLKKAKFVDPDTVCKYGDERLLQDGDLLWNSTGLGTLGRMAIYDSSKNKYGWAVADSHVTVIRTREDWLDCQFAFAYFAGPSVQTVIEDQASGSTKQKELAQETVRNYLVPIPPLAEQRHITRRIERLFTVID